jgi:site-specific DNA-methyltransferase (adenine-specific)
VDGAGRPLRLSDSRPSVVAFGDGLNGSRASGSTDLGRWPANVIMDEEAGAMLDAQSGNRPVSGSAMAGKPTKRSVGYGGSIGSAVSTCLPNDSGGASRFFYCPKASRAERDAGLEAFEARSRAEATRRKEGSAGSKNAAAGAGGENCRNIHPTVKPIALARYLARLILPPIPDARMLTPFSGSGSEVIGALQAGWSHVDGIDSWDVAVRISRARIAHWASRIEPVQLDLAGE